MTTKTGIIAALQERGHTDLAGDLFQALALSPGGGGGGYNKPNFRPRKNAPLETDEQLVVASAANTLLGILSSIKSPEHRKRIEDTKSGKQVAKYVKQAEPIRALWEVDMLRTRKDVPLSALHGLMHLHLYARDLVNSLDRMHAAAIAGAIKVVGDGMPLLKRAVHVVGYPWRRFKVHYTLGTKNKSLIVQAKDEADAKKELLETLKEKRVDPAGVEVRSVDPVPLSKYIGLKTRR